MSQDTRAQFLDAAEALFAQRGFYGVSISAIADELGLTKQALLHHFGSKERLYAEVLRRISADFTELPSHSDGDAASRLKGYLLRLYDHLQQRPNQTRLLVRELLDNNERAESAGKWYLAPFLKQLTEMVQALPSHQHDSAEQALAFGYLLLGAMHYYGVSAPTLTGIVGKRRFTALDAAVPEQLEQLLTLALER